LRDLLVAPLIVDLLADVLRRCPPAGADDERGSEGAGDGDAPAVRLTIGRERQRDNAGTKLAKSHARDSFEILRPHAEQDSATAQAKARIASSAGPA
jgi:hypothetical protein